MSLLAILPARGGSKRLPRKNILPLRGRAMILYPLEAARQSGLFDRIIVSTEDGEIRDICEDAGVEVFSRSSNFATDEATVVEVCGEVLKAFELLHQRPSHFCCIYPTAAFLLPDDLRDSFRIFEVDDACDAVMSVSRFPLHPFKAMFSSSGYLQPMFPDKVLLKGQLQPEAFGSNGTFYWSRVEHFVREKSFYAERLRGYVLDPARAVDIDTPGDYEEALKLAAKW